MSRPDPGSDPDNFLLFVPEIRHSGFTVTAAGRVVLALEIHPIKRMVARLVRREPVSDLELDDLSSSAWLGMDGERSILDLARIQCGKTGDDLDQAVERMVKFMRYLAKRGWIRFKKVKLA